MPRSINVTAALILSSLVLAGPAQGQPAVQAPAFSSPPVVVRSNLTEDTVWNHDRTGAPSENGTISLGSPTGSGATTATVNSTGSNVQVNTHTVAQPGTVVTSGELPCEPTAKSWTVSSSTCNASLPRTFSRQTGTAVDSLNPTTGQATYACTNGTWASAPSSSTCITSTCSAQANYWTGSATCGANFPVLSSGQSLTLSSVNGNTGSATFTCNAGAWQLTSNGGCTAPSVSCNVKPVAPGNIPGWVCAMLSGKGTCQIKPRTAGTDGSGYPTGSLGNITVASGGSVYIGAQSHVAFFARFQCTNGTMSRVSNWIFRDIEYGGSWTTLYGSAPIIGPGNRGNVSVGDSFYAP